MPRIAGLGYAWLSGLFLDVLRGMVLGQHALGFLIVGYVTHKLQLQMRMFPILQQAAIVLLLLGLYHFVVFWIDGLTGHGYAGWVRWLPVISGALLWICTMTLSGYAFGNLPVVEKYFELVVIGVIAVSLMPIFIEWLRGRKRKRKAEQLAAAQAGRQGDGHDAPREGPPGLLRRRRGVLQLPVCGQQPADLHHHQEHQQQRPQLDEPRQ